MQKREHIPGDIELLVIDYLNGVIDKEGYDKLNVWLSRDAENIKQLNQFRTAWIASGKSVMIPDSETDTALMRVKGAQESNRERGTSKPFWTFYKIAASWVIFMVIGGVLNYALHRNAAIYPAVSSETKISAPIGSRSVIDLPDGSKVWLNAGSQLSYSNNYGLKDREVTLTGEGYFSVKTNKSVPFLVKTSEVIVKALGTKFNVKAYPEEPLITATLEEGVIEVTSCKRKRSFDKVTLKPNEMITYVKDMPKTKEEKTLQASPKKEIKVISNVNTEPVTSWKDRTWIIEAQPLGLLAPIFERRYNIQISFSSDEISKFKFTGKIEDETIEQIMSALELSAPISFKMEKNHLFLTIDKNRINRYMQNTKP
jgi:transmembrane sensor